ncbi:MAG: iron-containing alcohol dehydrogenase [Chloroflexota bacterium]
MAELFRYSNPGRVFWGPGCLEQLAAELDRLAIQKPFLISTRSLAANGSVMQRLAACTGRPWGGTFASIAQHAPAADVARATEAVRASGADGIVSLGGGSPIDAAKVVALAAGGLPHVALPTTLSVAELSPAAGVTNDQGRKVGQRGDELMPKAVFYDAGLALDTPLDLWLSTGIRALDHAVEGILAPGEHPFSDIMALEAIRRLFQSLPRAKADPTSADIRTENQLAAWFSFTLPLPSAGGLSHVLGKQIGSPYSIPHGVTSCLLLPHVMRYLGPTHNESLRLVGSAMGVPSRLTGAEAAQAAADAVGDLIDRLGQPRHLAAYGLTPHQLRAAAQPIASASRPLEDLVGIYQAAW